MTTTRRERIAVVGVDFSEASDDAILWGLRWLSDSADKRLHLAYVLDPRDVIPDTQTPVLVTEERVLEQAPQRLQQRAEAVGLIGNTPVSAERIATHARI